MRKWSIDDLKYLKTYYNQMTNEELLHHFNDKTWQSIYKAARRLGLYRAHDIAVKNRSNSRVGSKSSNWHGGISHSSKGYVLVKFPGHPRADTKGYVLQHILVMESIIGRHLYENECVHHINKIKNDNRPENLRLMTKAEHTKLHHCGAKRTLDTRMKISIARRKSFA